MPTSISLPPVFRQRRSWKLVSVTEYSDETHMRFESHVNQHRIDAIVMAIAKGKLTYVYNWVDPTTSTMSVYHGPHGDPALDEVGAVAGINL